MIWPFSKEKQSQHISRIERRIEDLEDIVTLMFASEEVNDLLLWTLLDDLLKENHKAIDRMKTLLRNRIANVGKIKLANVPAGKEQLFRDAYSARAQQVLQKLLEDPLPYSK